MTRQINGFASIEKPWLKYYDFSPESIKIPELSMFQLAESYNKDRLNQVALELRSSANGFKKAVSISYRDYFKFMRDAAAALKLIGVKPDEIIPVILPNIPESRISIYGSNIVGATPYLITPMLAPEKLGRILFENDIKNFIIFSGFYDKYKTILDSKKFNNVIFVSGFESFSPIIKALYKVRSKFIPQTYDLSVPKGENFISYDEFVKEGRKNNEDLIPYYDKNHIAAIVGTSGTTGVPKGVKLSDYNLNAAALQHISTGLFSQQDVFLDVLLQSIAYGLSAMHYTTCGGLKSVLIPELVTDKLSYLLKLIKPDHFLGGPVHCLNIARSDEFKNGEIPPIKNYVSGGATLKKSLEKALNNVPENYCENQIPQHLFVRQGLGSTENTGGGLYAIPGSYKFGGVGIPLPLETIGVFEPNTFNELPYNTEGELCICGPMTMKEYLNNPEETYKVLKVHPDGKVWLHTGDLGIIDEDGQFFHKERISRIFMRQGFNVHPNKICEYLETLPMIKHCAVVGVDHPDEEVVPIAFIVLDEKFERDVETARKEIYFQCQKNLDDPSIPFEFIFLKELPINLGGKVDENLLRKIYFSNDKKEKCCKILELKMK